MARLNKNANDETNEGLSAVMEQHLPTITITTDPVAICGVSRRATVGQYEHIDIYYGLGLPMVGVGLADKQELERMCMMAAEIGFNISSHETYARYKLIKDAQSPSRPEKPTAGQ